MMAKKQRTKTATKSLHKKPPSKAPFIDHIQEFRRRLMWVAASVVGFSVLGYFIQARLVDLLLKPAADQQFIYTTPGGGINFLLQVCIYFGVALSIPVIAYQLLRFVEPLFRRTTRLFIFKASVFSAFLALCGMAFGYFVGLPAAVHFLSHQSLNSHIEALLSVSDYLSFVTVYLAGAAIMFQLPLVLLLINRITPLKPSKLLKAERWVILASFIVAAVITPTPDPFNQSIIAGPIILTFQLGVFLVWFSNKRSNRHLVRSLSRHDKEAQARRMDTARSASAIGLASLVPIINAKLEPVFISSPAEFIPVLNRTPQPVLVTEPPVEEPAPEPEPVQEIIEEPEPAPIDTSLIPGRRIDRLLFDALAELTGQEPAASQNSETTRGTKPPTNRFGIS